MVDVLEAAEGAAAAADLCGSGWRWLHPTVELCMFPDSGDAELTGPGLEARVGRARRMCMLGGSGRQVMRLKGWEVQAGRERECRCVPHVSHMPSAANGNWPQNSTLLTACTKSWCRTHQPRRLQV